MPFENSRAIIHDFSPFNSISKKCAVTFGICLSGPAPRYSAFCTTSPISSNSSFLASICLCGWFNHSLISVLVMDIGLSNVLLENVRPANVFASCFISFLRRRSRTKSTPVSVPDSGAAIHNGSAHRHMLAATDCCLYRSFCKNGRYFNGRQYRLRIVTCRQYTGSIAD